jgi:hypothetical protein
MEMFPVVFVGRLPDVDYHEQVRLGLARDSKANPMGRLEAQKRRNALWKAVIDAQRIVRQYQYMQGYVQMSVECVLREMTHYARLDQSVDVPPVPSMKTDLQEELGLRPSSTHSDRTISNVHSPYLA